MPWYTIYGILLSFKKRHHVLPEQDVPFDDCRFFCVYTIVKYSSWWIHTIRRLYCKIRGDKYILGAWNRNTSATWYFHRIAFCLPSWSCGSYNQDVNFNYQDHPACQEQWNDWITRFEGHRIWPEYLNIFLPEPCLCQQATLSKSGVTTNTDTWTNPYKAIAYAGPVRRGISDHSPVV